MANVLKVKKREADATAPVVGDVAVGELALNVTTGKLYAKIGPNGGPYNIKYVHLTDQDTATLESPSGSKPGTSFTISRDATLLILIHKSIVLTPVGATPNNTEYTRSGTSITTGATIQSSDFFVAVLAG